MPDDDLTARILPRATTPGDGFAPVRDAAPASLPFDGRSPAVLLLRALASGAAVEVHPDGHGPLSDPGGGAALP